MQINLFKNVLIAFYQNDILCSKSKIHAGFHSQVIQAVCIYSLKSPSKLLSFFPLMSNLGLQCNTFYNTVLELILYNISYIF